MSLKKILKKLIRQEWGIGFIMNSLEDVVSGKHLEFKWVYNPYKNRWFADPFLLDVTDNYYIVLAEDYEDNKGYACISRLKINRNTFTIEDVKKILDDGTHMSFPVILRKLDGIYVHPENSVSGKLKLYKYDNDKEELIFHSIMSDLPLTDAVTLNQDGESTMFATQSTNNPNGRYLDILEKKNEKYEIAGRIDCGSNIARMAGDIFTVNGKMYRPAQDNNERYGGALIIQELNIKNRNIDCKNIRRITSTHPKLQTGLHTFNEYKSSIVVDVHGYSGNKNISAFFNKLRYIFLPK